MERSGDFEIQNEWQPWFTRRVTLPPSQGGFSVLVVPSCVSFLRISNVMTAAIILDGEKNYTESGEVQFYLVH